MNTVYRHATRLKPLSVGILLAFGNVTTTSAATLNFIDGAGPGNTTTFPSAINSTPFTTTPAFPPPNPRNSEFRMVDPTGTTGGGGEKNIIDGLGGDESWTFDDGTGLLTSTGTAFPSNPGAFAGAAPTADTNPTMEQAAPFFGSPFNFLAPTVGSLAATAYGNCQITSAIVTDPTPGAIEGSLQVFCPVLEAQWGGTYFPLGLANGGAGITFNGALTNMQLDTPAVGFATYDFRLTGEHTISQPDGEDPGSAGFNGWSPQWDLRGSGAGPFKAGSPPTATPGALSPTTGSTSSNDGRVTQAEVTGAPLNLPADDGKTADIDGDGVDDDISSFCVGSCWDYTVTGLAGGQSTAVTLPLSSAIPTQAVYRKYNGAAWVDFDTSTGDTIESAPGALGDCSAPGAYVSGLVAGNFCVRLTIADGGPNDLDGIQNGVVVDPGGVAEVTIATVTRPGQTIDDADGCSLSSRPVSPLERADWWIVATFLALLGLRRKIIS